MTDSPPLRGLWAGMGSEATLVARGEFGRSCLAAKRGGAGAAFDEPFYECMNHNGSLGPLGRWGGWEAGVRKGRGRGGCG